jgi:biotin carboxyl carrier protein
MNKLAVTIDGQTLQVEIEGGNLPQNEWTIRVDGELLRVSVPDSAASAMDLEWLVIGDRPYGIHFDPELHWVQSQGRRYSVQLRDLDAPVTRPRSGDGRIKAPIPGQVTQVLVAPEQRVAPGDTLFILEAMKMENHILAPLGGSVTALHVAPGQGVMLNEVLAEITAANT